MSNIFELAGKSLAEANKREARRASFFVCLVSLFTGVVIVSLALFPLHIAMIVMGAKYKDKCPVENMIPIYLIVSGVLSIFANCFACGMKYKERRNQEQGRVNPLLSAVQVFLFVWFICGNAWIYRNYEPNYSDPSSSEFCNKTLYLFAFWATTSYYIVFGITFIISCGVGIYMCVVAGRAGRVPGLSYC